MFHEFRRPPYGGGNQFLLALTAELRLRGLRIENNTLSRSSRACLFNSFNFDFDELMRLRRPGTRMVHRVDGPVDRYRGRDEGVDRRIQELNARLADATVFQSRYSLEAHSQAGLRFRNPTVIMNAVDQRYFFPASRPGRPAHRKIRLVSTSWSANPNKGAATYKWIEDHLDWTRFDYTFVGRSPIHFDRIRMLPAVPSKALGEILRQHDVYIAASLHDPCSNALIEALACGLPAVYANSGGHPEIVGSAGLPFAGVEEIPSLLERVLDRYDELRASIETPSLPHVADLYLEVMGLHSNEPAASASGAGAQFSSN